MAKCKSSRRVPESARCQTSCDNGTNLSYEINSPREVVNRSPVIAAKQCAMAISLFSSMHDAPQEVYEGETIVLYSSMAKGFLYSDIPW